MIEIPSDADIQCSAEKIFDVIIDFRGQDRWLTPSSSFHGTSEISSNSVVMRYTLTPQGGSTHVRRVVTLGIPWSLKLVQPVVVRAFRDESERTLLALKAYADQLP
jgi:hypothetical protein